MRIIRTPRWLKKRYPGWRLAECGSCGGCGLVSVYSQYDFEGPRECKDCGGSGTVFITPKGRLADYPGGPLRGMA